MRNAATIAASGTPLPINVAPAWAADWAAAWERQKAGNGNAHIACIGDSITEGTDATAWTTTYASVIHDTIEAETGVYAGTGWVAPHMALAGFSLDTRLSFVNTWTADAGLGFQGFGLRNPSASAGVSSISFTPTRDVSSFTVHYAENTLENGTWTVEIDDVQVGGPYSTGNASNRYSVSFSTTLGAHTLKIRTEDVGLRANFTGVEAVANANSGVRVTRCGKWGSVLSATLSNTSNFGSTAHSSRSTVFDAMAPDLLLICYGLNEFNLDVTLGAFETNLTTAVNEAQSRDISVALVVSPPPNEAIWNGTGGDWSDYQASIHSIASAEGAGVFDITADWGSYTSALMADEVHPNDDGYARMGRFLADEILNLTRA